jgi:hypothetical protein
MSAPNEEAVLRGRHQIHALDVRRQLAVELVHLELILEVRDRPQPLHQRSRTVLAGKIDQQSIKDVHFDIAQFLRGLQEKSFAFVGCEQRLRLPHGLIDDADDDLFEHMRAAFDDVDVAVGDRVV